MSARGRSAWLVAAVAAGSLVASTLDAEGKGGTQKTAASSGPKAAGNASAKPITKATPKASATPLAGTTYDFTYDGKDKKNPTLAYKGRAFVPTKAAGATGALPAIVFVHGLNREKIEYRWIGGGSEGDVRRIVGDLVNAGTVAPMLVLAPTSTNPDAVAEAGVSWPAFDLDKHLSLAEERLKGVATIDRSRVIVAGHSGGACNPKGGAIGTLGAVPTKTAPLAALVIDTCMTLGVVKPLAHAPSTTHVVVSYQKRSWAKRGFQDFARALADEVAKKPPGKALLSGASVSALRLVEELKPTGPAPHDEMVPLVMNAWLPKLVPPPAASGPPSPAASASSPAPAPKAP